MKGSAGLTRSAGVRFAGGARRSAAPPPPRASPASASRARRGVCRTARGAAVCAEGGSAAAAAATKDSEDGDALEYVRGSCYGCGVRLQVEAEAAPGYVERSAYEKKAERRQWGMLLCTRCSALSNGQFVNAVAGQGSVRSGRGLVSAEQLRAQLERLRDKKALVVKVVDLLDFQGSFLNRVRDLVGGNPIVLVANKADLVPKGVRDRDVVAWLEEELRRRRLRCAGVHLVSARTGRGLERTVRLILGERRGRDVYVLGAANVGKSTFIRAALAAMREQGNFFAPDRRLPTASGMPGTTLGVIPLRAFEDKGALYDTPGVLVHHRLSSLLDPEELKPLMRSQAQKLTLFSPPTSLEEGAVFWWGGVLAVEVLEAPPAVELTFIGPKVLRVAEGAVAPAEGAFGAAAADARGGLVLAREVTIPCTADAGPLADVVPSGYGGWIRVSLTRASAGQVRLAVRALRGVEVFLRPPFPINPPRDQPKRSFKEW